MRPQITRLFVVFGILVAALLAARRLLVPATFGRIGHYRAAAVDAIAARPVKFAGHEACAACHDEISKMHDGHRHRGVACEVCHGPAQAHVEAPTDKKPVVSRTRDACPLCHGYDPSRPTGFPQIDPVAHNPLKPCYTCHNPHAPEPPRTPEDCSACHAEIARTKAVSRHALLACNQCHETAREHKINPTASRPSKPSSREFCGQCHAREATSAKNIPRVDLASHGERYLCWQCHYPHFPESK